MLAVLYAVSIAGDPPGLYDDEAATGYNAWTIAHYGVDQYGNHLPLFFTAFGDYKPPLATYLVAPLTWLLPNGAMVVRLPAVLAGIATFLIAGRLAFRLTGSRATCLTAMTLTALQPWLFLQSHTFMEANVGMVLCVMAACWCIAEAAAADSSPRWWTLAGVALAVAVFSYTPARVLVLLLAAAAVVCFAGAGRRLMLRLLFPVAVAYVVLAAWGIAYPAVLFARFDAAGIFSGGLSPLGAAGRFAANYASYFSPDFLLFHGDGNYRQTTGFGGVLLAFTLPLMVIGAARLIARRHQPYARCVLLGSALAPVPAALALVAPHALRGAGLFPFLIVLMIEGLAGLRSGLQRHPLAAAALAAAVVGSSGPYYADFFTAYPARAAAAFDAGEGPALAAAFAEAQRGGHKLFLSASLNQPAMQLMYAVAAPPPQQEFVRRARITVVVTRDQLDSVATGDVLVFGPEDRPPAGAHLLLVDRNGALIEAPVEPSRSDLLRVYRI
jgi:4-amino-4-deoxy-L-arabinose transferase-like glycosyltransferase